MNDKKPMVSVGLPLYNAEEYLRVALDSLLSQTFTDFELIISDNASTDDTEKICREYMARDDRISYSRNEKNVGGSRNFNRVFDLSSGKYFRWAAHDDLVAPTYLERCVSVMEADPDVVLCHSKSAKIDVEGKVFGNYDAEMRLGSVHPHVRFGDMVNVRHFCTTIFGLMRREILAKTPLMGLYIGSDRNLLAEIALHGKVHEIPEYLFFRRDHPRASVRRIPNYRERLSWFDTSKRARLSLPYWRNLYEFLLTVTKVDLDFTERALCYLQMLKWTRDSWKLLAVDLAQPVLSRTRWGYKYYAGGYGS